MKALTKIYKQKHRKKKKSKKQEKAIKDKEGLLKENLQYNNLL